MTSEAQIIKEMFGNLRGQVRNNFPPLRNKLHAPLQQGVYIIYKENSVLHVGRTLRAENGLNQRLKDHLSNRSSFSREYLGRNGSILRDNSFFYKYLVVEDSRLRALLEAYTIGCLCPKHLGTGD